MSRSGTGWVRTPDGSLRRLAGAPGLRGAGSRLVSSHSSAQALRAAVQGATSTLPATVEAGPRQALIDALSLAACTDGRVRRHELGLLAEALVTCPAFAADPCVLTDELVSAATRVLAEPPVAMLGRLSRLLAGEGLRCAGFRLAAVAVLAGAHVWSDEPSFLSDLAQALGLPPQEVEASVQMADALLGGSVAPAGPATGDAGSAR